MKKNLLITAIITIISYTGSAQATDKDRLANIELTAQQKTSIDSVRKIFDEKRTALKKDTSLSAEALVTKRKELQKEQVSVVNWITPSVHEQYVFWMPIGRSAGIMVETFWQAYVSTKKEIYLAKAKSIAGTFTKVQKEHNGDYPTFFTKYPMNLWLNSTVYPAKVLMTLQNNLNKLNKK